MLSERERRALACIERHLMDSDPDLVRLFRGAGPGDTGATPRFLLYAGLALLVLGGLVSAVPVALTGMVLAMFALVIAHVRPTGPAWPSTA